MLDILIVGAGPAGLSLAIEAQRAGLSYEVIEKGALVNSILRYPTEMTFFSTPSLLEIGGVPFSTPNANPTRQEGLGYYRRVAEHYDLNIRFEEKLIDLKPDEHGFVVTSSKRTIAARIVVLATGYFDNPKLIGVPGESLPTVEHYYTEAHPYFRRKVAVIGSKNSAAEAALDLCRHGAEVTMIVRGPALGKNVKYWLKPNLENRIKSGAIRVHYDSKIVAFEAGGVLIEKNGGAIRVECDHVFALTGYQPNVDLLRLCGVEVDSTTLIPSHNPDTFETNVPGLFIAGSVACGCETGTIFIENGRLHAFTIVGVAQRRLGDTKKTRSVE